MRLQPGEHNNLSIQDASAASLIWMIAVDDVVLLAEMHVILFLSLELMDPKAWAIIFDIQAIVNSTSIDTSPTAKETRTTIGSCKQQFLALRETGKYLVGTLVGHGYGERNLLDLGLHTTWRRAYRIWTAGLTLWKWQRPRKELVREDSEDKCMNKVYMHHEETWEL